MQTEEAIEIERCLSAAVGFRNRDVRPHVVVAVLAVRHDDIQAINRAALKDRNQRLAPAAVDVLKVRGQRALEKRRRRSHHSERGERDAA